MKHTLIVLAFLVLKLVKTNTIRKGDHLILINTGNNVSSRVIKYDEIVYFKQKKSNLPAPQQQQGSLIYLQQQQQQQQQIVDNSNNNLNELQKTIQNILMIEHYSRDNLQQYKMIYECNEKLKTLENEFNSLYLDEWQKQSNKSLRYLQPQSTTRTARNLYTISGTNLNNNNFNFNLNSRNLNTNNMLENVRKHLVDYLKAELENNYKIIQELRLKIESLNKTKMMPQGVVPPVETIHQFASSNYQANKTDMENDCTMVSGTGFLQIQLTETNLNPNTQQKVGTLYKKQTVLCESQWLIIQQRLNGFETSFNRSWGEYVTGFGSLRSDFWAGLELISQLTQRRAHKLHIELTDWSDQTFYAQYERFEIGNEDDYYRLSLSSDFSGNASRDQIDDAYFGMLAQNGAYFSTYDNNKKIKVNNTYSSSPSYKAYHQQQQQQQKNCALKSGGGWWFNNFSNCLPVNLNGVYVNGASAPSTRGIKWQAIRVQDRNYALKKSRMKIKPVY